jgi:subtilisin
VLVGFLTMPGHADKAAVAAAGGAVRASYANFPVLAAELPAKAARQLERNPRVLYIEPDLTRRAIAQQIPWGIDRVEADAVWPTTQGEGVSLAILDTGGDNDHPDLSYAGGVSFAGWLRDGRTAPKWWNDVNGHGTWTSGIAAALDNDTGVIGAAPGVSLHAVKVLGNSGSGYDSDIAQGIDWAISNGIDVISMSLGGPGSSTTLAEACQSAWDAGILLVAAAGNEGDGDPGTQEPSYPADLPTVMSVGATTQADGLASFSNTGPNLELAAPGVSIYSTYKGGGYSAFSGTSGSCPHVAGVAALAISADPSLTNADVRSLLQDTAEDLGPAGWDPGFGHGLVNAAEALGIVVSPAEFDAAVTGLSVPGTATIGDLVSVTVELTNHGLHTENVDLDVAEFPDGELIGSDTVTLAPGGSATLGYTWDTAGNTEGDHTVVAEVHLPGDEQPSNDSRSAAVTLSQYVPPPTGLDITVTTSKGVYTRGEWVYITVLATDGGSPAIPVPGAYNLVEIVTASGRLYAGEDLTDGDGTSVHRFKPKNRDGFGTYFVTAVGQADVYTDTDSTTFEVVK